MGEFTVLLYSLLWHWKFPKSGFISFLKCILFFRKCLKYQEAHEFIWNLTFLGHKWASLETSPVKNDPSNKWGLRPWSPRGPLAWGGEWGGRDLATKESSSQDQACAYFRRFGIPCPQELCASGWGLRGAWRSKSWSCWCWSSSWPPCPGSWGWENYLGGGEEVELILEGESRT